MLLTTRIPSRWVSATPAESYPRYSSFSKPSMVEEFFLACNKDSDLYPGMQQGDNGQSMVLGLSLIHI